MSLRPFRRIDRRTWLLVGVGIAVLLVAASAVARPGGGQSYSGGSHSSSSGGRSSSSGGGSSGGGGELIGLLVMLCVEHPAIGIPVVVVLIGIGILSNANERNQRDWSSTGGDSAPVLPSFDAIRAVDPAFSRVVFEDFVYGLYAEVQRTRGLPGVPLDRISAYVSPEAAATLRRLPAGPVEAVIVGAMRPTAVEAGPSGSRVTLTIESNYTEAGRGCYVVERWTLTRGPDARSRTPDRVGMLGCPSCGAPQDALFGGSCRYCHQHVNSGAFDWVVSHIQVVSRESRGPMLTSNVAEQGTDSPSVVDRGLERGLAALSAKDPSFTVDAVQRRVGLVFDQFQRAWSARELSSMRPFLSDALFSTQQYWVSAYLAQRLRNVTENARITALQPVKVASDPFFDAITFRLYATSLDYTVDDAGRVVSGSRKKERAYSEYWTMIRGTNRKGAPRADLACPNCGAPLAVNMAGQCGYCHAKLTSGEFDWVLSRIEQDDSYAG